MKRLNVIILTLSASILAGCTDAQQAGLAYAESAAQGFKNSEAKVLMLAPCAMSVGAYWRVLNSSERRAVNTLCGE